MFRIMQSILLITKNMPINITLIPRAANYTMCLNRTSFVISTLEGSLRQSYVPLNMKPA